MHIQQAFQEKRFSLPRRMGTRSLGWVPNEGFSGWVPNRENLHTGRL